MSVTDKMAVPKCYTLLSFHLIFFKILCAFSPRPDWWCIEVKQMDSGWGIGPASLWHWALFKPGKWSMLNLILNTRSFTPANRRRMEASIWQDSWGTLIRDFKSTCSCSCACVLVCCYLRLNGLLNTGIICLVLDLEVVIFKTVHDDKIMRMMMKIHVAKSTNIKQTLRTETKKSP